VPNILFSTLTALQYYIVVYENREVIVKVNFLLNLIHNGSVCYLEYTDKLYYMRSSQKGYYQLALLIYIKTSSSKLR